MRLSFWRRLRHLPRVLWAYLTGASVMVNCTFDCETGVVEIGGSGAQVLGNRFTGGGGLNVK